MYSGTPIASARAIPGLSCDRVYAAVANPLTTYNGVIASTLLTLPLAVANNDRNPDRVKARNLFDPAFGTDNLFHTETIHKVALRFAQKCHEQGLALYNFLSTFSGTHFVPPRTSRH